MILFLISFIAGVLTVLAPCVLPLLPVIVGGSIAGERNWRKAYTISISLGLSVFAFTILLKVTSAFINVPPEVWQWISGGILILFGFVMLFPALWDQLGFVNKLNLASNRALAVGYQRKSRVGDVIMGAALGPVFSSCSPTYFVILATVLPASYLVGVLDLTAYCVGLAGFLLVIALVGQRLVDKLGVAIEPTGWFRRGIGALFILVGLAVFTGAMAHIEAYLLDKGFDATVIEQRLLGAPAGSDVPPQDILNDTVADTSSSTASIVAPAPALSEKTKSMIYKKAPELVSPDGYVNTNDQPISIGEFKGKKVVLLDIWTYSCINCQRTLPYIKMWYDKYHDQGLEIIGVHTPEFSFEKVQKNVEEAVARFGIKYPVILDNEYQTWNALGNSYWPRKYLIDIDGYIVYDHAGEGNYDETEKAIQKALKERDARLGMPATVAATTAAPSDVVAVDSARLGSPETYFGAARNEFFSNGTPGTAGAQTLTLPADSALNALYLGGSWNFLSEYAQNTSAHADIVYRYRARHVYFVASAASAVKIHVTRDGGKPLGDAHGADIDAEGNGLIQEDRLYELVNDADYGDHTLEIEIVSPGVKAYTFTFG